MPKRIPISERAPLIRAPASWARDWGWTSRRRAVNLRKQLDELAWTIENAMEGDEGAISWAKDIRRIAKALAPEKLPVEKKRARREKVAAVREP